MKIEITNCTCPHKGYRTLIGKTFNVTYSIPSIQRYMILEEDKNPCYVDFSDAKILDETISKDNIIQREFNYGNIKAN